MPRSTVNSSSTFNGLVNGTSSSEASNLAPSSRPSTSVNAVLSPEIMEAIKSAATQAALAALQAVPSPTVSRSVAPIFSVASQSSILTPAQGHPSHANCDNLSSRLDTSPSSDAPLSVPAFVQTFTPSGASVSTSLASVLGTASSSGGVPVNLPANIPTLNQPFVVGPGFSPIPHKLVSAITSGKFIDLDELLSVNLASDTDEEPQLLLDGRLILTSSKRKSKHKIEDIVSWMEAFSIYCLVLTSCFPHRWRDLSLYKLLILRTYQRFGGRAWLSYDRAFREHAAATRRNDWSNIESQLFNFHTAGAARRVVSGPGDSEAKGSPSSDVVCHSWNRGSCTAPSSVCRFAHRCSSCRGPHRLRDCDRQSSRKRTATSPEST